MITMILATDINYAIGNNNSLLYSFKKDMKFFKSMTEGKEVVMGSRTWHSLPNKLPDRINSVLSTKEIKGCDNIYRSVDEILSLDKDICIIGGATLYKQFIDYTETVFLTKIDAVSDYDTDVREVEDKLMEEFIRNDIDFTYDRCRITGKYARLSFHEYIRLS